MYLSSKIRALPKLSSNLYITRFRTCSSIGASYEQAHLLSSSSCCSFHLPLTLSLLKQTFPTFHKTQGLLNINPPKQPQNRKS